MNSTVWHKHLLSTQQLPLVTFIKVKLEEQCKVLIVLETELCLGMENHGSCSLVVGEGGSRHSKMLFKKIDSKSVSFLSPLISATLFIFYNVTVFFTSKFRFTPQMTMWHDSFISLVCVLIFVSGSFHGPDLSDISIYPVINEPLQ